MTFPIETEATVRRRLLQMCQDHSRIVIDTVRELSLILDAQVEKDNKEIDEHQKKLNELIKESRAEKNKLLEEIAAIGSLLISRESFLRLIYEVERIADEAEASAYRFTTIFEGKWKIDKGSLNDIASFMSEVLEQIIKVRETMILLGFNPEKALEMSKDVEEYEEKIDMIHRQLDVKILNSKLPIPAILLLRDVLEHIENISDIGVSVVDLIRLIAIYG